MRRALTVVVILATIVSVVLVIFSKSSTGALISIFTDHLREETYSLLFTKAGFKIFYEPMVKIVKEYRVEPAYVTWPLVPFDRPLGCALIFLPFACAVSMLRLPVIIVNKLVIIFLVVVSGIGLYEFFNYISRSSISKIVIIFLTLVLVPYILFWAMNGIYDVIAFSLIMFAISNMNSGRYVRALIYLSAAMFIHYRAIIYVPLLLYLFIKTLINWGRDKLRSIIALSITVTFIGITLYTGYLTFLRFPYDHAIHEMLMKASVLPNPLNISSLSYTIFIPFIAILIIAIYILYNSSTPRDFILSSSCMLTYSIVLMLHPLYQFWYPIVATPLIAIPRESKSIIVLALWFLLTNVVILTWFIIVLSRGTLLSYVNLFKSSISL